ncbi:MAG: radical SAM protein [Nitrospiraceae bacterium]|nr:radical SAM protein [Nitrospiraceae bacterium]
MKQLKELEKLEAAGPAARYDFFIQWHLTERCNLRCRHCYQMKQAPAGVDLSLEEVRRVIAEISDTLESWARNYQMDFSPSFNITGGEPFLRADLFDILSEARTQGFDVYLLTNGTIINMQRARALAAAGVRGVQVSVEGPEEVHDSIRGRGSFSQAMWGVKNLLGAGLTVTLNATLSRLNAGRMPEMVALALAMGVQRLGFSRLVPYGRGLGLVSEMLTARQVKGLYETLLSLDIEGLQIVTGDPVASQMSIKNHPDAGCIASGGCAAGISGFTILADGTITPCRRLPLPLGNVRTDSIRRVWAASPVLEALREKSRYGGRCGDCRRWANCRGCRAIAYAYSMSRGKADFLSEDPQCFIAQGEEPETAKFLPLLKHA